MEYLLPPSLPRLRCGYGSLCLFLPKPQLIVKHEQPISSKKKSVHVIKAAMDLLNLHKDTHLFELFFICLICLNVHVHARI